MSQIPPFGRISVMIRHWSNGSPPTPLTPLKSIFSPSLLNNKVMILHDGRESTVCFSHPIANPRKLCAACFWFVLFCFFSPERHLRHNHFSFKDTMVVKIVIILLYGLPQKPSDYYLYLHQSMQHETTEAIFLKYTVVILFL